MGAQVGDDLNPIRVLALFSAVSDEDCELLALAGRPEGLVMTHLPVPPVCIRPSVEMDTGGGTNEDDITMKLMVGGSLGSFMPGLGVQQPHMLLLVRARISRLVFGAKAGCIAAPACLSCHKAACGACHFALASQAEHAAGGPQVMAAHMQVWVPAWDDAMRLICSRAFKAALGMLVIVGAAAADAQQLLSFTGAVCRTSSTPTTCCARRWRWAGPADKVMDAWDFLQARSPMPLPLPSGQGHGHLGLRAHMRCCGPALAAQLPGTVKSGDSALFRGLQCASCPALNAFARASKRCTLKEGSTFFTPGQVNAAMYINSDVPGLSQANQPNTKPLRCGALHVFVPVHSHTEQNRSH